MKGGAKKSSDYNDYDILMEIGALDDYDVFRDPNIKYVIATEDTKIESNQMLELILQSSGMSPNSYHILPYAGCSKVDSAIYVSKCLKEFRQDLKIIIHRDRDGMTIQEGIEFAEKIKESGNSFGFITQYNDLEVYFCIPAHIQSILQQKGIDNSIEVSENILNDALSGTLAESKEKYLNRKLDSMRAQGRGAVALEASTYFDENILQCVNGHLLSGAVVAQLHKDYHISKSDLISYSEALGDSSLRKYVLS